MSATPPPTIENGDAASVDGRTLRKNRNRTAVIVALLDLIREGNLDPSTSDIADRAGVSDRSIFRYFDDLDDLVRTTIAHAFEEAADAGRIENFGNGTFDERVEHFVDARIKLFTRMDGAMRVVRMRAYELPSIDEQFETIMDYTRGLVRTQFAPEIAAAPDAEQDHIIDAVLMFAIYDIYAVHWRMLRHDHDQTRAAVIAAIRALLLPVRTSAT